MAVNQPQQMLRLVSRHFYENMAETAYTILFFLNTTTIRSACATTFAVPSALLLHNDGRVERVDSTASVAGLFLEFNCAMAERPLCPGHTLKLHADGVTECYSPSSEN